MSVSIIVVTYNSESHIHRFLESAIATSPRNSEVIVIDNSGKDYGLSFAYVNKDGSYPSGLNHGMGLATKEHCLCCNPDIVLPNNWFDIMNDVLERDYHMVGPVSNFASGIQGMIRPNGQTNYIDVKFMIGFCFLMKRSTYDMVGPFDEQFVYEQDDIDYCYRMNQNNMNMAIATNCFVNHVGHASALTSADAMNTKRWLSFYRLFKKYPHADFPKYGIAWSKEWLNQVAINHPEVLEIESYKKCEIQRR